MSPSPTGSPPPAENPRSREHENAFVSSIEPARIVERHDDMRPRAVPAVIASALLFSLLTASASAEAATRPAEAARKVSESRSAPRFAFAALIALSFGCLLVRRRDVGEDVRERR